MPQQIALPEAWRPEPVREAVERILDRPRSSWSISTDAARTLVRIAESAGARRLLEFGAGVSSLVLATTLEGMGGGSLTSVEQNPDWCEAEWKAAATSGDVDGWLIASDLEVRVDRHGTYTGWKERSEIERRGPYDLVLVDAPWGGFGRDGALVAAFGPLVAGGLVVLDDAWRGREQRTVRRWLRRFPSLELVANDPSVGRGLTVLRKLDAAEQAGRSGRIRSMASWLGSTADYLAPLWCIVRFHRSRWRPRG